MKHSTMNEEESTLDTLTLVHFSDVHLDQAGAATVKETHAAAFMQSLAQIKRISPGLVLFSGDLFDSNRAPDDVVRWAMEQLGALRCPVVMIPGNHDCLEADGIYQRHHFEKIPNVTLLRAEQGELQQLSAQGVAVWGKGMVNHAPEFLPLADLPTPRPGQWNLALGHGIYMGDEEPSYRSSPVMAEQIAASGYDYIALGHHHAVLDVSRNGTSAHYAGSTVPVTSRSKGSFLRVKLCRGAETEVTVHQL